MTTLRWTISLKMMVYFDNIGIDHGYYDEDDMMMDTGKKAKYEVYHNNHSHQTQLSTLYPKWQNMLKKKLQLSKRI